jgi:hypothetical protein
MTLQFQIWVRRTGVQADAFHGSTQTLQATLEVVLQIRTHTFPSTSFSLKYN